MILLAYWRIILLAALLTSSALFFHLWRSEVQDFKEYKLQVEALGKAQAERVKAIVKQQEKVTKEIKDAIPKQIKQARSNAVANYIKRMPVSTCSSGVPPVTDVSSGVHAPTEERVLACTPGFIQDSAEDASTIIGIQNWVRRIGLPVK